MIYRILLISLMFMFLSSCSSSSIGNNYALAEKTKFIEGTSKEIDAITEVDNWINIGNSGYRGRTVPHPYELLNIHKVHSFSDGENYLTGVGQTIHIADFHCDDTHEIYNNKTIHNLDDGDKGESTFATATTDDHHCQFVAGIAAGDRDSDIIGVAPDADLVLSRIPDNDFLDRANDLYRAKKLVQWHQTIVGVVLIKLSAGL